MFDDTAAARRRMVEDQLARRGIADPEVLAAMAEVPRHLFLPMDPGALAYDDHPLPIDCDQTISQPYVVARMTELAVVGPGSRVLEVGTGSGYQAAVLATIGCVVHSVEVRPRLAAQARRVLAELELPVEVHEGDGWQGWPDAAPYDAILVTAAAPTVPQPLLAQLAEGGRLVIPVGPDVQRLELWTRRGERLDREEDLPVMFVPLIGEADRWR